MLNLWLTSTETNRSRRKINNNIKVLKIINIKQNQDNFSTPRLTLRESVKGCSSAKMKTILDQTQKCKKEWKRHKFMGKSR